MRSRLGSAGSSGAASFSPSASDPPSTPRKRRGSSPAMRGAAAGPRAGRTLCITVLVALVVLSSIGAYEYLRLTERAAGFETAWNPITTSWDAYFEGEKRSSKQTLYNLWHGAGIFPAGRRHAEKGAAGGAPRGGGGGGGGSDGPEDKVGSLVGPTLEELLRMPSKYPFDLNAAVAAAAPPPPRPPPPPSSSSSSSSLSDAGGPVTASPCPSAPVAT